MSTRNKWGRSAINGGGKFRRALLVMLAGLLVALGLPLTGALNANAAEGDPEFLQIDKSVSVAQPQPGQSFQYSISLSCSDTDCLDAVLTDPLPEGLDGFEIQAFQLQAVGGTIPTEVTWQPGNTSTTPATVGPNTSFTIDLLQPTNSPAGIGLQSGSELSVVLVLKVPDDYPPGTSPDIVNTAYATATNAAPVESSATININSPVNIAVSTDKVWQNNNQAFNPGSPSTIELDTRNTSNIPVDVITIQEPKAAPNGATSLDPSNPFTITDFTGFSNVSLPAGCENVQVDAYVQSGGTWSWVSGASVPATNALSLPAGVTNADVGGIRITCTGDIGRGETISVDLGLEQRATHRNTGDSLATGIHTVNNTATGSVALEDGDPVTDDGNATYVVRPLVPTVEAAKNIDPSVITAGQDAQARITGTNGGNPVQELHLADLDFFTEEITFGGFDGPLGWPSAANSPATITYHLLAGGTETVTVAQGATPAAPSGLISGFEIVWTGPIAANESGYADFTIETSEDATGGAAELTVRNTVDADVTASNGLTAEDSATDDLRIVDPRIEVELTKNVRPGSAVQPGDTVISSLAAHASAYGDTATINEIVIADEWAGDCSGFWNAFNLEAIAPTQVPAETVMTIEVQDAAGNWHQIQTYGPEASATVFQMTPAQMTTALSGAGLNANDVQGIRFTFTDANGFPADLTITPNVVFEARGTLRDTTCPAPPLDTPVPYTNTATTDANGETEGGKDLTDHDEDTGVGVVEIPTGGPGPLDIDKEWDRFAVSSQSSERAVTHLDWNIRGSLSPVSIVDMPNPAAGGFDVADSVFDAFNLVSVNPVAASNTPYTSGWYLKYDTITEVALYSSATNSWQVVPAPAGTWMTAARGFKGYDLTPAQQQTTLAVRITLAETAADTAARQAAQQSGAAFDPYAPAPGSGVGSGSTDRRFDLTWELRDKLRSDGRFVTEDLVYNNGTDEGVVNNIVTITGTPIGGGPDVTDSDNDTILIQDQDPLVEVTKSVTPTSDIFTPPVGSPPSAYEAQTATWSIVGHNASVSRASYVRLTDPATCTDTALANCQSAGTPAGATANPFDTSGATNYLSDPATPNPFERFDATSVTIGASIGAQVDLGATTVHLLRFNAGAYTVTTTTATAVNAMTAAQLADVVGISVTFQGSDPATTGGTITQANNLSITIASHLRPTLRSTGADLVLAAPQTYNQTNRVFAQSYDPVTAPGVVNGDTADATTQLTGGIVNITPTKSVTPTRITKPQHDADNDDVTVTVGANQGSAPRSTLSPQRVIIEDLADSPDFWNTFEFTGLGAITMPAGADQVQVDVYDGSTWQLGTPGATATLPAGVDNADVQGIRFTFSRADGGLFSNALPAANWSAAAVFTVNARDTYRDSGEPIEFPSTVTNTQSSQSTRPDGNNSEVKDASAAVEFVPGTQELAVNKLTNNGNRVALAGTNVPFDLTLRNTGTGYLTLTELVDNLPSELVYTGDPEPVYTPDPDGTLSDDVTVTPSGDGTSLTFTWPEDGNRMQPGEEFKIRIWLELQPGLGAGETATNTIVAHTEEPLDRCTNTVQGGATTPDWSQDNTTCGASDFIGTVTGRNIVTVKGVRGSLPGAYNPSNPAAVCNPTLTATGGQYYRAPCVAHSQVGGTDDWVLHNVNAGTIDINRMVVFEQLPVPGDQRLVQGAGGRGSQYRPELIAGSLGVTAPAGATWVTEVTTSANVCVNTWATLTPDGPVCEASGEVWTVADGDTDWSQVSGLRVTMDFTGTQAGVLRPGQAVDVTFSTFNALEGDTNADGASTTVPASDQLAFNQYGLKFRYADETAYRKIAPNQVGVHLRFGAIEVAKEITGPAAQYAPEEFLVDVACQVGTGADAVDLDLGDNATVELNAGNGYSVRINGVPISEQGTSCTVTEQGDVGEFGETSRSGTPATLEVTEPTDPSQPAGDQDVPAAQIATITNDYQFTGLSVTKRVDTEATDVTFGPFEFTLACVSISGQDVVFDGEGTTELTFTLEADGTFTAPANRIPVGATCTLAETDSYFADHLVITGDNVVDNGDGTATITPGEDPAEVEVTNAYDAGTVTLNKVVEGDGADLYGTGTFVFDVTCTYQEQTPFDGTVELRAGGSRTLGPYPAGTQCTVSESRTAGATSHSLDPADGVVTVPYPDQEPGATNVAITATNVFDVTSLEVDKVVTGATSRDEAQGPFQVSLACTWLVDGNREAVDIPGGPTRTLSKKNGYHASYADLPSSSKCTLTETDSKDADKITITSDVNGVTKTVQKDSINVDLTETDGPGNASVEVTNYFKKLSPTDEEEGDLPGAGSSFSPWLLGTAVLLLLAGATMVMVTRRRRV